MCKRCYDIGCVQCLPDTYPVPWEVEVIQFRDAMMRHDFLREMDEH